MIKDLIQQKTFKYICYHTVQGTKEYTLIQQFSTFVVSHRPKFYIQVVPESSEAHFETPGLKFPRLDVVNILSSDRYTEVMIVRIII